MVHPENEYLRCFSRIRCHSRKGSMASGGHLASERHSRGYYSVTWQHNVIPRILHRHSRITTSFPHHNVIPASQRHSRITTSFPRRRESSHQPAKRSSRRTLHPGSSCSIHRVFQVLSHFLKLFRHPRLLFLDSRLFAGMKMWRQVRCEGNDTAVRLTGL